MTDRELLELAYKAAFHGASLSADKDMQKHWNPLTDDGDALRLASKLRFTIKIADHECEVFNNDTGECLISLGMHHPTDAEVLETTREGIVRAAAEIGRKNDRH